MSKLFWITSLLKTSHRFLVASASVTTCPVAVCLLQVSTSPFQIYNNDSHVLLVFLRSSVVGNIPPYVAGDENPRVPTPYSTEIMEGAKTDLILQGIEQD